jgi:hypothetical protein
VLGEMYYRAKSLVRPITRHRRLWERAKYSGARILSPQEGDDLIAASMRQSAAVGKMGSMIKTNSVNAPYVFHKCCV